jgi:hypothetical protein
MEERGERKKKNSNKEQRNKQISTGTTRKNKRGREASDGGENFA